MTLTFEGRAEVWFDVDPSEWVGLSKNDIAEKLWHMAQAKKWLDYDQAQFQEAADRLLSALASGAEGMRW